MRRIKQTTATTLVLELLRRDERLFLTARQLRERLPQLNGNQISAALYSLLKYHAVDFVTQNDGMWWFARRAEDDTRYRVVEERTPETKKRKQRKSKS